MNEKKEKKLNKTECVLEHLKKNGCITSWEAIDLYGATRLSAIIYNLRHRGYSIDMINLPFVDRFGSKSRFGKYILIKG